MDTDRKPLSRRIATLRLLGAGFVLLATAIGPAQAGDPVFRIVFDDGKMTPARLEVPADTRFELELVNDGKTPAEFESLPLRKEKVIAPGVTTSMIIKGLEPGEYSFFDDFHPDAPPAVLIAK